MPIRLNLLAEQQAAEEARRRDPVKRSIWAGGCLVALFLLWSGLKLVQGMQVRAELNRHQAHWESILPKFQQVSNHIREVATLRQNLSSLEKYASNRFLWTRPLNALQHCTDSDVRLVSFSGASTMSEQKQVLITSNHFVMLPPKSWWKWWREPVRTNVNEIADGILAAITNRADLLRYQKDLTITRSITTNPVQIVTKVEVIKPETVSEKISLTLKGRDYSDPPAREYEQFYTNLMASPYFGRFLSRTNCLLQPESIQLQEDGTDLISPTQLYLPFTIEAVFPERIRTNE